VALPAPPRLAPIRTKFALSCAFALITLCNLATAPVARSAEPAVARPVFVTPVAGDRSAAERAVVAAGGIPERWVRGRLKAALGSGALAAVRRSPAVAGAQVAETSSADAVISQGVELSGADALQRTATRAPVATSSRSGRPIARATACGSGARSASARPRS
jgi:hypothetical protein